MFHVKQQALAEAREVAARLKLSPSALAKRGIAINQDGVLRSALELLAYPDIGWSSLVGLWPELASVRPDIAEQLTDRWPLQRLSCPPAAGHCRLPQR